MIQIFKGGRVVSTSRNLRGIVTYSRKVAPKQITLDRDGDTRGWLYVEWCDGASVHTEFASYHIMVDWVRNRRRFRDAHKVFNGPDVGYLTKPGIIGGVK